MSLRDDNDIKSHERLICNKMSDERNHTYIVILLFVLG